MNRVFMSNRRKACKCAVFTLFYFVDIPTFYKICAFCNTMQHEMQHEQHIVFLSQIFIKLQNRKTSKCKIRADYTGILQCKLATRSNICKPFAFYLCPERKISFDGFVHYEGRRFGVPYWYTQKTCRIRRDSFTLYIYASDLSKVLTTHDVTWMRRDSFCRDQYVTEQTEEVQSMPVKTRIFQIEPPKQHSGFEKFNFEEGLWDE